MCVLNYEVYEKEGAVFNLQYVRDKFYLNFFSLNDYLTNDEHKAVKVVDFLNVHEIDSKDYNGSEIKQMSSNGYKENAGKLSYADLPWIAIEEMAKVEAYGKVKYPRGNSKKDHRYTELWDAAFRHMKEAVQGNDLDNESQELHLSHAAWNICTLIECIKTNKITDNRLK